MRTGVIAKKLGMTRLFKDDGRHVPVTVLSLEGLQVISRREMDKDGYTAVQLGAGTAKAKNVAKPQRGHFGKAEVEPKAIVAEFRVDADGLLDVGAEISADHYVAGQLVDIQGRTQGKGFVKGSVPGSKGGWLFVKDAVKVAAHKDAPYPAGLKAAANSNTAAPAETPAEDVQAPEATEGQEG